MKYWGTYSMLFADSEMDLSYKHFCVDFEVDEFTHPGARLRFLASEHMKREQAVGMAVHRIEEFGSAQPPLPCLSHFTLMSGAS